MDEYDEDYDEYYSADLVDQLDNEINYESVKIGSLDLLENYTNCVLPTLTDAFYNFLYTILLVNLTLKVILIVNDGLNHKWKQQFDCLVKISGGLYLIYDFCRDAAYIGTFLVLTIFLATLLTFLAERKRLPTSYSCLLCCVLLLGNECLIWTVSIRFRRLQAIMMLLFMKCISLNSYLNLASKENKISFLDCLTYVLHPQCLPLGGWNPVNFRPVDLNQLTIVQNFLNYFRPFFLSLFFLLASNCVVSGLMSLIEYWLLPIIYFNSPFTVYSITKNLLNAYFVALQFRCSHYFISYTMQYTNYFWDHNVQVTKPLSIEFPRSLVEVAIVWNIPMHEWLKSHLYGSLVSKFGETKSRLITFIISAMMHGYDFRVWSVLIMLAFLTWVEIGLRKKLSIRLNGCVAARSCSYVLIEDGGNKGWRSKILIGKWPVFQRPSRRCKKHSLTPYNSFTVNLINLFFSLLCIIHLAFLGSAFDGNERHATFEHVYEIWSFLNFYSIFLLIATYLIYLVV